MSDPLLDIAVKAAWAGGEEIMRIYAEPFEVRHKEDKTPVTEADLASERVIERMLRAYLEHRESAAESFCDFVLRHPTDVLKEWFGQPQLSPA